MWREAEAPFVLLVQLTLFDPSRAPAGKHIAWGYCHVPRGSTLDMTARIEAQIERFAPGFRRRIGVIYQDFRLIRHLTAFDNVALPLRISGADGVDVEGPVREMLAWVGLADRASATPPTLSGGEQQRLAIARAVIARPELLVADEPTGNVDSEMASRILHLLTALNRLGTTIIIATHDLSLIAATPGANMLRLDNGAMVDPTGSLKHPPRIAERST